MKFLFCGNIRRGEPGVKYNQLTKDRIVYEDPFEVEAEILNSKFKTNYQNLGIVSGDDKLNLILNISRTYNATRVARRNCTR